MAGVKYISNLLLRTRFKLGDIDQRPFTLFVVCVTIFRSYEAGRFSFLLFISKYVHMYMFV